MKIPFTIEEFFHVFEDYNLSVWPAQLLLYMLAIVAVILAWKGGTRNSQVVFFILAIFWIWSGLVYHIRFFSTINRLAYVFGGLFIFQGIIFLYDGVLRRKTALKFSLGMTNILGVVLIVYSLLIYRMIGYYQGHVFPTAPTFGVPCPTTIFTFGMLLFSNHRVSWHLFIIPTFWSLIGFSAALNLSIVEDYGLAILGILAATLLLIDNHSIFRSREQQHPQTKSNHH